MNVEVCNDCNGVGHIKCEGHDPDKVWSDSRQRFEKVCVGCQGTGCFNEEWEQEDEELKKFKDYY